ncbi:hypothetical protein [Bernardetia sp. MNP-M8]|uniref:hypothetical protein n=1 Tax=Bernardetia sp. MNP-M8 TaxID=3127470 RepID=UPI0030D53CF4
MFLSIKQALEKYEASQTTLTRFARENQKTKNVKKEGGKFYILDSFLASHFQAVNSHLVSQTISANSHSEEKKDSKKDLELVTILKTQNEFLQNQIKEKDKQLNDKSSQIDKLLQRQYEQNSIIQTMQNRFENLQNGIDNGVKMLSESVKEQKPVTEKGNDNGFTIASAVMIILLVVMIIIYLTVK